MKKKRLIGVVLIGVMGLAGGGGAWGEEPANQPSRGERRAIERLRAIEREIRQRASEADEEVLQMRQRARDITREAQEESDRIKAEADAYTRRIEQEIQEIRKRGGISPVVKTGPPSREELETTLKSAAPGLVACWEPRVPASARPKAEQIERCLIDRLRRDLAPLAKR